MRNSRETYSNLLYGSRVGTGQNNCYAYALDVYKDSGDAKLQPGDLAGLDGNVDLKNCDNLVARALADGRAMGWDLRYVGCETRGGACSQRGAYMIVAVVAPDNDFHWYRHHKDLLYRVQTPRTLRDLAAEFDVRPDQIAIPGDPENAATGDLVLVRGANVWSHKQGFSPTGPLLKDACGKVIKDPALACRDYGGGLNYKKVCGAFCLRKK
jgi:hypothetical protein